MTPQQKKHLDYTQRMQRVCDYIDNHLADALTLDQLCQIAHFSKFHFHRQFANSLGLTVAQFIRQARLKRASYQLAFRTDIKILEIALQAGFETPESFSRCFKQQFNLTPSQFRKHPDWVTWHQHRQSPQPLETSHMYTDIQPDIVTLPHISLAVAEHRGDPNQLNHTIARFIEWRKQSGLSPVHHSRTFGLAYDDPETTPPEEFRFDICGSVKQPIPNNSQGIIPKQLPAGRYAKIRHVGSHEKMPPKIYALYGHWLPQSGEELNDFPCFFEYLNFFPEVAEHELITDIYLPLKPSQSGS